MFLVRDNGAMSSHRIIAASAYRVPQPFGAFAVRSEEARHAFDARAPYQHVHLVRTDCLDARLVESLTSQGYARVSIENVLDVDYAATTWEELAATAPGGIDLAESIAAALRVTGVLGGELASYRGSVATRVDHLASRGAGFHNDVRGHWSRCLFWVLAIDVGKVEFVMPHAGVQLALAAGDLVVFDPTMAHGLCRPGDGGQVLEESCAGGVAAPPRFLAGEMPRTDAQRDAADRCAVGGAWRALAPRGGARAPRGARPDGGGVRRSQRRHQAAG
jgi:hypothetical protein